MLIFFVSDASQSVTNTEVNGSDEFELEFPELSYKGSEPRHFNFRAETELDFFLCIAFLAQNIYFFLLLLISEPENQSS